MYKVKKVFNNNISLVENKDHQEFILLGNGIAFQKKVGDNIDETKIDKRFILDSSELGFKFHQLFKEIPITYIDLTVKIVESAEKELNTEFDSLIYIGLSDHIRYALARAKDGVEMPNAMLWEIKRFYPREFQAAENILNIIYYYEKIWLTENEIGYIALHFVNAQSRTPKMSQTIELTEIITDIMRIVQLHFKVELNSISLSYTRFATHISYLIRRLMNGELSEDEDSFIFHQMVLKYPECHKCAIKISDYLEIKTGINLEKEELVYLMIHINRVVNQSLEKEGK